MDTILELNEVNKIKGQIYRITNIKTSKIYIGQTLTHRKNKNKYRPYGYMSRFKSHVSEAINNTKKKQCTYLNNSIRKYGNENFTVELIETCSKDILDEREIYYIEKYNSLYPIGYNLTRGGKCCSGKSIKNNSELNEFKKRGRDFGYKHKESTKNLMSKRLKKIANDQNRSETFRKTLNRYYDDVKIKILLKYPEPNNLTDYIHNVRDSDGNIKDKIIKLPDSKKLKIRSEMSIKKKEEKLINLLKKAYQGNNCQDSSEE